MAAFKVRQGDALNQLNVDDTELSFKEKNMIDMLYPKVQENPQIAHIAQNPQNVPNVPNVQNVPNTPSAIVIPQIDRVQELVKDGPKLWSHFKGIFIATALFIVVSLPLTDTLIAKVVTIDDPNYRLAAKAALFALLFFLIDNFYLSRAK